MTVDFLSREETRAVDGRALEEFGIPGVVLMENAGRGAAELLVRLGIHGGVTVCCGKGNNGGDGFVIARHLHNHGVPVQVLVFCRGKELHGDAAMHFHCLTPLRIPVEFFSDAPLDGASLRQLLAAREWVVDALLGTGLSGPARSPLDEAITAINASPAKVLAVDIPSGMDCDTGRAMGSCVRALHTVTFVANKKGFVNPEAGQYLGRVHVVGIGL